MKISTYILLIAIASLCCCKKESYTHATIVKNCTGTYLKIIDKSYKVCNTSKTDAFAADQSVLVSFNLIKKCSNPEPYSSCSMAYLYDAVVNVANIKQL